MDSFILEFLSTYPLPTLFLGSFFFGESVIISAAFLSGQGMFSIFNVLWITLLGTLLSDTVWFLFGPPFFRLFFPQKIHNHKAQTFLLKVESLIGQKPFLSLLFIKFLYGSRILMLLYLSFQKIKFSTFFLFNTIGALLWLAILLPLGWLAGKGLPHFFPLLYRLEYALLALVCIIIFFKSITLWLEKKVEKR